MGWEFSPAWQSMQDLLNWLDRQRFSKDDVTILSPAHITGEGDYVVRWQAILWKKQSHVICDLMQCSGGQWGYKDLSDNMGPAYLSCPISIIDVADCHATSEPASRWRSQVRQSHSGASPC